MQSIVKLEQLNKGWYCRIRKLFNGVTKHMDAQFEARYKNYMTLIKSKTVTTPT